MQKQKYPQFIFPDSDSVDPNTVVVHVSDIAQFPEHEQSYQTKHRLDQARQAFVTAQEQKLLQGVSQTVTQYSKPAVFRALTIQFAHGQLDALIPRVVKILMPQLSQPFDQVLKTYRHAYTRYLEALGLLSEIFSVHGYDLMIALGESKESLMSAFNLYIKAINRIPDLDTYRNNLEAAIDSLSQALLENGGAVNSKTHKVLEEAEARLNDARKDFEKAEIDYKSNSTALIYFQKHEENTNSRVEFLKNRMREKEKTIQELERKLKEAQNSEKKTTTSSSNKKNFFGLKWSYESSETQEIITEWTQERCQKRLGTLREELKDLDREFEAVLNKTQDHQTQIRKMEETFKKQYETAKKSLEDANEYHAQILSKFLDEKRKAGGVDTEVMVEITQILTNLKTFALTALPNLSLIGNLRKSLTDMVSGELSAKRIIGTLRPLADAYVEDEILRQLSFGRAESQELGDFLKGLTDIKARAIEADPMIAKGDPRNIDAFAAQKTAPITYPL